MSGGQRQRVALGRAIVREPKVMLLDEPLSNLDAKLRTQMRSEIVKLHKKLQTTFIYVTHDQVEAMTMGTRIVVMKDGFIKQIDTPKNLYKYPANKFVAGFIGTPQMNFFEGTILKDGDRVCINFANSQARLTVPYSALTKVIPHYLDGEHKVTIGFRAEDISLDPVKVEQSQAVVKVKVSHTEELGTETLVYGDINLDGDDFTDTGTRVIIKSGGFKEYESGEVVEAAFDIGAIHLFDSETEESILPRVPEYNYLNCTVSGNKLRTLGTEFDIPPAISCDDGEYELLLPVTALANGETKAKVIGCEKVSGSNLLSLDINGVMVFTISDLAQSNGEANIGIDFKQITLRRGGENVVQPLPLVNSLDATFIIPSSLSVNASGLSTGSGVDGFQYMVSTNGASLAIDLTNVFGDVGESYYNNLTFTTSAFGKITIQDYQQSRVGASWTGSESQITLESIKDSIFSVKIENSRLIINRGRY